MRCRRCHRKRYLPLARVIPKGEVVVLQRMTNVLEDELQKVKEQIGADNLLKIGCFTLTDGTLVCYEGANKWEVQGRFD